MISLDLNLPFILIVEFAYFRMEDQLGFILSGLDALKDFIPALDGKLLPLLFNHIYESLLVLLFKVLSDTLT